MKDYFIIGKLGRAHGIQGEIKCFPLTDDPHRFEGLTKCLLLAPDEKLISPMDISKVRVSGDQVCISFSTVSNRDAAQKLCHCFVAVPREAAAKLPEGRYFIADLVGCRMVDLLEGELGLVKDILQTGANDVFVVSRPGKPELLVPYLNRIVQSVDISNRLIQVELPEGLLEIYSGSQEK